MRRELIVLLFIGSGCASPPQTQPEWPSEESDDLGEYIAIADARAAEVLDEFNAGLHAERLGGPFHLEDYGRSISRGVVSDRAVIIVAYQLQKSVSFLGHPQHFAVQIDMEKRETQVFGGR